MAFVKNIIRFQSPHKLTTQEVELRFTKMLVARLLDQIDGHPDAYLSDFDKEAIELMKSLHPQDKADADFEGISLNHWETLNPDYVYREA